MRSQVIYIVVMAVFTACCFPIISYGQVVYDGQVVDKNTEFPVAGVTVQLLKAKIGTITTDQGYFSLSIENVLLNDTLIFTAVGYRTFQLPVSAYRKNLYLLFHPTVTALEEVAITNKKLKDIVLNKFVWAAIADDRDIRTFSTRYAFAKLFTAPNGNMVLKGIALGRKSERNVNTRFLLHVMNVNPSTGGPGRILFTKTVSLNDRALLIRIDLSDDNVVIADSQFYIAVEWLRVPYNEVIHLGAAPRIRKVTKKRGNIHEDVSNYRVSYQPELVGIFRKKRAISWVKIERNRWAPYNSATTGLEIVLSATVHH